MKIEQQVVSLELSKRLRELGVKQESMFMWTQTYTRKTRTLQRDSKPFLQKTPKGKTYPQDYSAFTVAELGEMLPKSIYTKSGEQYTFGCSFDVEDKPYCFYENIYGYFNEEPPESGNTEADARAEMLIYLLENKLISLT